MGKAKRLKEVKKQANNILGLKQEITFSGPIPPPDVLAKYGDINGDFPNRILKLAEKEQDFRHKTTVKIINKSFELQNFGMRLGFIILLLVILLAGYLAYLGNDGKAIGLAISGILFYGGIYLYGIKQEQKDEIKLEKDNQKKIKKLKK